MPFFRGFCCFVLGYVYIIYIYIHISIYNLYDDDMARHGIFMLNFRIFALFLADVYAFQSAKLDKDMPGTCECVLYFGEVEPSKLRPKLHSKQGSVGFLVSGADGQIITTPNGRVVVDPHLVEWP